MAEEFENPEQSFLKKHSRWITGSIGALVIVLGLVALVLQIEPPAQQGKQQQISGLPAQELAPSFDIVRINRNGSAIFSGTATAGATIILSLNQAPFAETQADIEGDWIYTQGAGLQAGKYIMRISARLQGFADNTPDEQLLIDLGGVDLDDDSALPNAQAVVYAASTQRGLRLMQSPNMAKDLSFSGVVEAVQTEVIQVTEPAVVPAQEPVQEPVVAEAPKVEEPQQVEPQKIIVDSPVVDLKIGKVKLGKDGKSISAQGQATPDIVIRAFVDGNPPRETLTDAAGFWQVTVPISNISGSTGEFTMLQIRDGLEVGRRVISLELPASTAAKAPKEAPVQTAPQPDAAVPTITVKRGDSLWALAQRAYNDGTKHKKILAANKDQISSHKDLKPGMVLKVPK